MGLGSCDCCDLCLGGCTDNKGTVDSSGNTSDCPPYEDDPLDGPPLVPPGGTAWLCCAGVRYFDDGSISFTNPYPEDVAIFKFGGGVDDDFAYKRDSDPDWIIFEEGEHEFIWDGYATGCNGAHAVDFCAALLPGETIQLAAVNNFDNNVGISGTVFICKGTSVNAIPSFDGVKRMPSMATRAGNLGKALVRSAVNVVKLKQPLLEASDEAARRLAICKACPMLDANRMICKHANCGCYLKAKTYLRAEHCPLDNPKW